MLRGSTLTFAAGALVTLSISTMAPAAAAPGPVTTSLAGTWRVSRTCVSGCAGSTTVTEVVRPYAPHVFLAHGGLTLVLYQLGDQVLVHGAASSPGTPRQRKAAIGPFVLDPYSQHPQLPCVAGGGESAYGASPIAQARRPAHHN